MARARGTPLARSGDAPAAPPVNDRNSPVPTAIYENTGVERTPQPPFTVDNFVVIEGFFRQHTVQQKCENPMAPLCPVRYFVFFGGQIRSYTVHIAAIKKKKSKTENTPIN